VNRFLVDLHVHTALSPCASEDMTPPAIVAEAVALGLQMIAVCDHNSVGNAAAVQKAAGDRLAVLPGMEISTAEEVHILGIFPDIDCAMAVAENVLATLPSMREVSRTFGQQLLMDETGRMTEYERKMLSMASGFGLTQVVDLIKRNGGLAIASHIDRPSFSVFSQLGLFPDDAGFDAVEVTTRGLASPQASQYTSLNLPIITSSDSHYLTDLGVSYSMFEMLELTFDDVALTFKGRDGRRIYNSA